MEMRTFSSLPSAGSSRQDAQSKFSRLKSLGFWRQEGHLMSRPIWVRAHRVWNLWPQFNVEMGWVLEKGDVQMLHSALADLRPGGDSVSIGSPFWKRWNLEPSGFVPWIIKSPLDTAKCQYLRLPEFFIFLACRNKLSLVEMWVARISILSWLLAF